MRKVVFQDQHPSHRKNHLRTFVHVFFIGLCTALMCMLRTLPSLYTLQIIYYSVTFLFVLGLVYLSTSAIVIFPWSGPDHQYFSSGGCMAYTDHVEGYQYAFFTSMADQAVLSWAPMYYVVTGLPWFHAWCVGIWNHFMDDLFLGRFTILLFGLGSVCDIQAMQTAFCRCANWMRMADIRLIRTGRISHDLLCTDKKQNGGEL